MFELADAPTDAAEQVMLFGPEQPATGEQHWIKTSPGRGWFVYLRLYGPTEAAFNNTWRPGDITAR